MIDWHPLLWYDRVEQRVLLNIGSAHRYWFRPR
jgi:hypothetical protein